MIGEETTKEYPFLDRRRGVWREIVRYVYRDCGDVDALLELGAGYCDFINQYPAKQKICFEQNPKMRKFAKNNVDFRCEDAISLAGIDSACVQMVFASNFLEHLEYAQHEKLLPKIKTVLQKGGWLVLLQPNYRLCSNSYFDDETHRTIFSDVNIGSFLNNFGFELKKLIPGLLPFSMRSRLPQWPILVRLYLASPVKFYAAQMYVLAVKS